MSFKSLPYTPADEVGYLDNPGPVDGSGGTSRGGGERMVAYAAYLELSVKNIEDTKKLIRERIKNCKGFVVSETTNSVNARLPARNMDDFLNNVKTLGKTKYESKSGEDITDQYRDNAAALNSLKTVRDRYAALLEKAESVDDILKVEKELERLNLTIEKLEGRIKYAEQSVAYSIITVSLREPVKLGPVGWVFYGLYHGVAWLFVR